MGGLVRRSGGEVKGWVTCGQYNMSVVIALNSLFPFIVMSGDDGATKVLSIRIVCGRRG